MLVPDIRGGFGSLVKSHRSDGVHGGGAGAKSYVCYLCGDQFSNKTLGMHVDSCKRRWHDQQLKLEPALRKPLPPTPPEYSDANDLPTVTVEVQAFNSRMQVQPHSTRRPPCPVTQEAHVPPLCLQLRRG